ncbi:MAG: hypothetical protein LBB22_02765 [Treponema sp.]|jgi:hypothetical protein|nr:hypothetical protein [Treponema sp.]
MRLDRLVPVSGLNRRLNETVGQILKLNREKSMVKKNPVRRMVRPQWSDFG